MKRVWSDFVDPGRNADTLSVDPNNTYLYIGDKFFWLLGNASSRRSRQEAVGGIKVETKVSSDPSTQGRGDGLLGTFVKAGFGLNPRLAKSDTFPGITGDGVGGFESSVGGLLTSLVPPAPEGPVGIKAFLQPLYLNNEGTFLLLGADQLEFGKPGPSNNPQSNRLFVLTKMTHPEEDKCATSTSPAAFGACIPGQTNATTTKETCSAGVKAVRVCSTTCTMGASDPLNRATFDPSSYRACIKN